MPLANLTSKEASVCSSSSTSRLAPEMLGYFYGYNLSRIIDFVVEDWSLKEGSRSWREAAPNQVEAVARGLLA